LVGFYFGHRETRDLDLFTLENELENGFRLINEIAHEMAATVEAIQTAPDFRRLLVKRGDEAVVVDLMKNDRGFCERFARGARYGCLAVGRAVIGPT